jgi:GNAT superfamily N-acetyltransferase
MMQTVLLADRPDLVPTVAGWIHGEWALLSGRSLAQTVDRFAHEQPASSLPVTVVALLDGLAAGVASLRVRDSTHWDPGTTPWICNVYVAAPARGRGVAGVLCRRLIALARERGHPALYLASGHEGESLYQREGFVRYGVARHPLGDQGLYRRSLLDG